MVGQFKDDQLQNHAHSVIIYGGGGSNGVISTTTGSPYREYTDGAYYNAGNRDPRYGNVTRGKRKGVKFIIKVL